MSDKNSFLMSFKDNWSDEGLTINYFANKLNSGNLGIILGAGASSDLGLPKWNQLIDILIDEHADQTLEGQNEDKIEYLRTRIFRDNTKAYLEAVSNALWRDIRTLSRHRLRRMPTLAAISSLIMAASLKKSSPIITLNYDNLVELYLKYHGWKVTSIWDKDARHWFPTNGVTVYHPHGFLPFPGTDEVSEDIILDQMSISKIMGDKSQPWYRLITTLLSTHAWFLIGLSGKDKNLEAMIVEANNRHIINLRKDLYWGLRFTSKSNQVQQTIWENRGIKTWLINSYKVDLPKFLFKVCYQASQI